MESLASLSKTKCLEGRVQKTRPRSLSDHLIRPITLFIWHFACTLPAPARENYRDFRTAAAAHSVSIDPLPNLETIPAPEENGATFAANAELKAVYYSRLAPENWSSPTTLDSKSTLFPAPPAFARRASQRTPAWWTRPTLRPTILTSGTTCCCCRSLPMCPQPSAQRATAASLSLRAMVSLSIQQKAQSKASFSKHREAPAVLATIPSSSCLNLTAPWPRSISKPSFRSAIAGALFWPFFPS